MNSLPAVEEAIVEPSQGIEMAANPKSVLSAHELSQQIERGVAPTAPKLRVHQRLQMTSRADA